MPTGDALHLSVTGAMGLGPDIAGHLIGVLWETLSLWHFKAMRGWCAVQNETFGSSTQGTGLVDLCLYSGINLILLRNKDFPFWEICLYQIIIMSAFNFFWGIILVIANSGSWVFLMRGTTFMSHFWCWVLAILKQEAGHSIPTTTHRYLKREIPGAENFLLFFIFLKKSNWTNWEK